MSYILMKVLESAPYRYDRGIKILTLGKIDKAYNQISENINPDDNVLDIGCGTGMLSFRAVLKDANVIGMDINSEMLEIAQKRLNEMTSNKKIQFIEKGVAELDGFEDNSFDVIMSGLCFSELTEDEIVYSLEHIKRILKTDGVFLLVDEVKSKSIFKRMLNMLLRIPLVIITYILTQTTSNALKNIETKILAAGLKIQKYKTNFLNNFAQFVIVKEEID